MPMSVNELADLADESFAFEDDPITAGLVVTIEDTEDEMMMPEDDMPEDDMPMEAEWTALLAIDLLYREMIFAMGTSCPPSITRLTTRAALI